MRGIRGDDKHISEILERAMTRYGNLSNEQMDAAVDRTWKNLQEHIASAGRWLMPELNTVRVRPLMGLVAVAAVLLITFLSAVAVRNIAGNKEPSGAPEPGGIYKPPGTAARPPFLRQSASVAFDVVSIRRSAPLTGGGGRGGGRGGGEESAGPLPPCVNGNPQVLPGRFIFPDGTLFRLIGLAYAKNCPAALSLGFISGGPEWIKLDRFDIQALMPEGSPLYTPQQLARGEAPVLQTMIQTLMADRFKLALHREMKEAPVYNLVVARPGRMKLSEDQSAVVNSGQRGALDSSGAPPRGVMLLMPPQTGNRWLLIGTAIPVSRLMNFIQQSEDRLIVDKTGLNGLFDIHVELAAEIGRDEPPGAMKDFGRQVLDRLGLKLEPAKGPVEILAIDNAERPTEN